MRFDLVIELLLLLTVANATPAILGLLLGQRLAWPLDEETVIVEIEQ